MSRPLLKFGGGSLEILRDVLHCDTEAETLIAGTKCSDAAIRIPTTFIPP